jgi:hypothetical protein
VVAVVGMAAAAVEDNTVLEAAMWNVGYTAEGIRNGACNLLDCIVVAAEGAGDEFVVGLEDMVDIEVADGLGLLEALVKRSYCNILVLPCWQSCKSFGGAEM